MRVLQLHWTALPITGGVEVHIDTLALQLRALGVHVDVVHGVTGAAGIYHPALDINRGHEGAGSLVDLALQYDLVHVHNPQWHKPEVAAELIRSLTVRKDRRNVVADVHNIDDDQSKWDMIARIGVPVIVHSEFVLEHFRSRAPHAEVSVLPLALDLRRSSFPIRRKGFTILQPTRLCDWKGSHLSLEAVMDLLDEGLDLSFLHAGTKHLIWPTGLSPELLSRMEPWQAEGRIRMIHYSLAESWGALDQVDLVLHPTIHAGAHGEPYSLSAAQALISGVPIIASRSGNVPRLLEGYGPMLIVPPNDVRTLREAIRLFASGGAPQLGVSDVVLAHELAQQLEGAGRSTMAFYRQLVTDRLLEI